LLLQRYQQQQEGQDLLQGQRRQAMRSEGQETVLQRESGKALLRERCYRPAITRRRRTAANTRPPSNRLKKAKWADAMSAARFYFDTTGAMYPQAR
jgi:hypothetical protein